MMAIWTLFRNQIGIFLAFFFKGMKLLSTVSNRNYVKFKLIFLLFLPPLPIQVRSTDPEDQHRERVVQLLDDFKVSGTNGTRILCFMTSSCSWHIESWGGGNILKLSWLTPVNYTSLFGVQFLFNRMQIVPALCSSLSSHMPLWNSSKTGFF